MASWLSGLACVAVCLCPSTQAQSTLSAPEAPESLEELVPTAVREAGRTTLALGVEIFHTTERPVEALREIEVPGTSRVLLWDERESESEVEAWYAISTDGTNVVRVRPARHVLELEAGPFDPLDDVPEQPEILRAPANSDVRLVQFETQPLEAYLDALAERGARVLAFVPGQGYAVNVPEGARAAVEELPFVRWVGDYPVAYKLEPFLRDALVNESNELSPARPYNILIFQKSDAQKSAVATRIFTLGGVLQNDLPGGRLLEVVLTPEQLIAVAAFDEVQFIDRWGAPEVDMDIAMEGSGGNYFHNDLGLTGTGVRGEVMDTGIRQTHNDFNPAPIIHGGAPDLTSDGTATYGIVFGDGGACTGGALTDGSGVFADSSKLLTSRYTPTAQLVSQLGAVFQTNSWGSPRTPSYTSTSADMDDILFDHDILIFQSQSNAGNTNSRPQAWAKNIVAVGGIRHFNTLSTGDDTWTGGASTGPASDGRIKPDLAHHYDSIATASSSSDNACTTSFCCTSAATPVTAAHGGLFFELWHTGELGNTPGADVFASRPHMTLSKAMLIGNANQWTFSGAGHDLGRFHQGFGRVNVRNIYERRGKMFWIDESDVLAPLATSTYELRVDLGEPLLRATLVFADPAGNPSVQSQHRVNDLDLTAIAPDGRVWRGNVGLDTEMTSTPNGVSDDKNTVEALIIQNPVPGIWSFQVTASEVNQDGHVETGALDADYALVVTGVQTAGQEGTFCDDSDGSLASCPCGNPGSPQAGCDNAAGTGGVSAEIVAFDPTLPQATMLCTGYPTSGVPTAVVLRSTAQTASPIVFGDGLRCVEVPVVRLAAAVALSGQSSHTFGHGAGAGTFRYQAWYRNTPAGFCTPDAFNLSSGVTVFWP